MTVYVSLIAVECFLNPSLTKRELNLAYKHELVHAILFEMDHKLCTNEKFVSAFSELLLEAEETLK